MVVSGWLILWLVINIFLAFTPEADARDRSAAATALRLLPTPAAIIPTPIVHAAAGTGGLGVLDSPPAAPVEWTEVNLPPTEAPATMTPEPPTAEAPPTPDNRPPTPEPPSRILLNGIPWEAIIVLPDEVIANAREIARVGRATGRNSRTYSKVGDSTTELPHFLARFDTGPYNLGHFAYLQPAVDWFHGSHSRDSLAVSIGLHVWTANDPAWAPPGLCLPNETPVQCEIRVHNPAVLLIRLGTNDAGVPSMFDGNIRHIVDTAIANGVIPVIGTKGDRHEGSNENNDILRRIAADYRIPLWDYDLVADTLPGHGLDVDHAHMNTFYAHDYTDPIAFTRGHAMHNLTALMMLDALWRLVLYE
jgi:hypothetical protein